jgi:pimeloyl-ACP methyl ester carboxylesterase
MTASAKSTGAGDAPIEGGGRIAYAMFGRAGDARPPLLLLRPLGGSMALWGANGFLEHLAAARRVIAFDARGTGRSSQAPLRTTTRQMAADALALLDHLGMAQVDVFGLSLGGMVATWLAIDAPGRVRRVVLGSTVRRGLEVSPRGLGRALSLGRCLLRPRMAEVEACLLRRILSPRFHREHAEAVKRFERLARAEPASRFGLLRLIFAAAQHDASAHLGRLRAPALLLWGDLDTLLRYRFSRELACALVDARLEIIAGCGHDLSLEQPLATAARINAFLAS